MDRSVGSAEVDMKIDKLVAQVGGEWRKWMSVEDGLETRLVYGAAP